MRAIVVTAVLVIIFGFSSALAVGLGGTSPDFRVTSGDGRVMTSGQTRGRVVVVFYTSRKARDRNKSLADFLQQILYQQPAHLQSQVQPLPIVDCTEANIVTKSFWQSEMRKSSQDRGLTVYGDWDGQMKASWNMMEDDSNVLILDKNGVVRYKRTGIIPHSEYESIKNLLKELVSGSRGS